MANLLWGKVYYKSHFAGFLREEPGKAFSFTYDESYLNSGQPAISQSLPLRTEPYISHSELPPFFDNLVAEGWLEEAQTRVLGKRQSSRFELLLAFGYDCAGAVSILDPEPAKLSQALIDKDDPKDVATLTSRASLSGIQPKLVLLEDKGQFRPAHNRELSTHIAKFPSSRHDDLVVNEFLSTLAVKTLLPEDNIAEMWLGDIKGFSEQALIIKRFDRTTDGERLHFEEFNQLMGYSTFAKYDAAYKDMADFIHNTENCLPTEVYRLYLRILAGILIGNTDMHLKNFAMFHTEDGLRLTPSYDEVAAAIYNYKTIALKMAGARDLAYGNLKANHIVRLGNEFQLAPSAINMAYEHLAKNIEAAKDAVSQAELEAPRLKKLIIDIMEKRWNGTFASIGKVLSKKP